MSLPRVAAALLVATLPAAAFAGAVDAFLAFTANTKAAQARFEQQVVDAGGRVVEKATGAFTFSRPNRFRWVYDKPSATVIVADGERLWVFDPDLRQATVRPMDRALSATPAALLAGRGDVTAAFTLRDAGSADGLEWLEATPRATDTGFDRVRVGMRGPVPAAMELLDSLGGRTVLRFPQFQAGGAVDATTFRFTPPPGTDVLQEAAPRK